MLISYVLWTSLALPISGGGASSAVLTDRHRSGEGPYLELWTNHDDAVRRGDKLKVYFRVDRSSYVTVFRIDTDGRVRVLFPRDPWDDSYARGDQRYEVYGYGDRNAFVVDDYPGQGYLFAVASLDPFNYGDFVRGDHWDYRVIAAGGRVVGDPYVALMDLIDRIVPRNYVDYNYDVVPYYVDEKYDYPRFLCYDCHNYAAFPYWDPYAASCIRFRMVIYDDPFYYPARFYPGSRVVYQRARRIEPRFVFKDRDQAQPYIVRVRERPQDPSTGRRVSDPGVTGRDLGGTGRVPAPIARPRTTEPSGPVVSGSGDPRRPTDDRRPDGGGRDEPRRVDQPQDRPPARDFDADRPGGRVRIDKPTDDPQTNERARPQLERREPKRELDQPSDQRREPPRDEPRREPGREEPRRETPPSPPVRQEEPRRDTPPATQEEPRRPQNKPQDPGGESAGGRASEPRRQEPPPRSEPRAEPRRQDPPPRAPEPKHERPSRVERPQ